MSDTSPQQLQQVDAGAWRRMALEAGPLVVFFVVNQIWGIFVATGCFMVATVVSVALSIHLERRVPIMPLVSAVFVLLFGGLTLWLEDDLFIKIKPTVVNLLFASVLFAGLAAGRSYIKLIMGPVFQMTDAGWRTLTWRWSFFFLFLAIVNEIVWRNFSTEFWAGFKLFGIMPITLLFGAAQIPLLMRDQAALAAQSEEKAQN
ncbi:MAG: septation protein A [Pseudomonadota bacterium]